VPDTPHTADPGSASSSPAAPPATAPAGQPAINLAGPPLESLLVSNQILPLAPLPRGGDHAQPGGIAEIPATGPSFVTPTPTPDPGGGAAATASAAPPVPLGDHVASQLLTMIGGGRHEATFELQPAQLGAVTVRVAIEGRDVSAWFGAPQPQVQQAVTQALDQLQAGLASAGFNLAGAWVGADTAGARQPFQERNSAARRPNFAIAATSQPAGGDADPIRRAAGVNIYV
jgi:hypothetical protein